jgi:hypothetical protein
MVCCARDAFTLAKMAARAPAARMHFEGIRTISDSTFSDATDAFVK